jgi:sugar phosphate isomerase/epimerase
MTLRVGMTTFGYLYSASLESSLESIASAGYRLVEIAPVPPHLYVASFDRVQRARLRQRLEDKGLTCVSINPVELNLISTNPALREVALQHYRQCIALAHDLGASAVVVIPGRQSQLIPMPREEATRLALEQLAQLAKDAHQYSVGLAVETVPFGFVETTAEVAALVGRLGDERVGMALDVANIYGREDVPEAVAGSASMLVIAHLSDTWRNRWAHTAIGTGEVNFGEFVGALEKSGFRGPCIYELVDGRNPGPRIAGDLASLKGLGLDS